MHYRVLVLLICGLFTWTVQAEKPQDFLAEFAEQAKHDNASFAGFDTAKGELFFKSRHGGEWSCSSCHTDNPVLPGKHIVTHKTIEPMAPAVNGRRFTNVSKVEKWFKRNCKDVVSRECTAQEKGDVLTYLLSLKL